MERDPERVIREAREGLGRAIETIYAQTEELARQKDAFRAKLAESEQSHREWVSSWQAQYQELKDRFAEAEEQIKAGDILERASDETIADLRERLAAVEAEMRERDRIYAEGCVEQDEKIARLIGELKTRAEYQKVEAELAEEQMDRIARLEEALREWCDRYDVESNPTDTLDRIKKHRALLAGEGGEAGRG